MQNKGFVTQNIDICYTPIFKSSKIMTYFRINILF